MPSSEDLKIPYEWENMEMALTKPIEGGLSFWESIPIL